MPVFNDQRDYLFHAMFDIHRAHVIMLSEQKIIKEEEAKIMLDGIRKVAQTDLTLVDLSASIRRLIFHDGGKDR